MQIVIDENEIQEALNDYCSSRVRIPEGKELQVEFVAGRGGNGPRATIDFVDPTAAKKEVKEIIEEAAKEPELEIEEPKAKEVPESKPKTEPEKKKAAPKEEAGSDALFGSDTAKDESPAEEKTEEVSGDSLFNL